MIKTAALMFIIALRMAYQPGAQEHGMSPFASLNPAEAAAMPATPARLVRLTGFIKNNRTVLEWAVEDNASAELFEVEKSTDGRNYSLAAIVFGNDKEERTEYRFREKTPGKKNWYRIKLIDKNKTAAYSQVITPAPGV